MRESTEFIPLFSGQRLQDHLAERVSASVGRARLTGRNARATGAKVVARAARRAEVTPLRLRDRSSLARSKVRILDPAADEAAADAGQPVVAMELHVPYEGDHELWRCRPHVVTGQAPRAAVEKDRIVLEIVVPAGDVSAEVLEASAADQYHVLEDWVARIKSEVSAHNQNVNAAVGDEITRCLDERQQQTALEKGVGIPLTRHDRAERVRQWFEVPVLVAALLVVPVIFIETQVEAAPWPAVAYWANWAIWGVFFAEYAVVMRLTDRRWSYTRRSWLDVFIIVSSFPLMHSALAATRLLRLARLGRLLRLGRLTAVLARGGFAAQTLMRRDGIGYVFVLTLLLALGAGGLYAMAEDPTTLGEGIWWAFVTLTTVGYGDTVPVTPFARVVGVLLMFLGIGFVAAFTAAVAARFVEEPRGTDDPQS